MIVLCRWITARHRTEIEEQGRKTRTLDRFRWRQIRSTTHPRYQTGFKSFATLRPHSRLLGSVRPTGTYNMSFNHPTFLIFEIVSEGFPMDISSYSNGRHSRCNHYQTRSVANC